MLICNPIVKQIFQVMYQCGFPFQFCIKFSFPSTFLADFIMNHVTGCLYSDSFVPDSVAKGGMQSKLFVLGLLLFNHSQ